MTEQEIAERKRVCAVALSWEGTPFHDNGEVKGPQGGVDCGRLLKRVFVEAEIVDPLQIADYSSQWHLHQKEEVFLAWLAKFGAHEINEAQATFGDVAVYHMGRCYSHGAIIIEPGWPHIVHAFYKAGRVVRAQGLDGQLGKPKHIRKYFSRW